jgi:hypothetical protein
MAGNLLTPRRRQLKGEGVEQMLCLKSWQSSGIIRLDEGLFTAVADDDDYNDLSSSNLMYPNTME